MSGAAPVSSEDKMGRSVFDVFVLIHNDATIIALLISDTTIGVQLLMDLAGAKGMLNMLDIRVNNGFLASKAIYRRRALLNAYPV